MCGLLGMKRNHVADKGIIVDFPTAQRFGGEPVIVLPKYLPNRTLILS